MSHPLNRDLLGPSVPFVTMIRNPADTYESQYSYYDWEKENGMNLSAHLQKLDSDVELQKQKVGPLNVQLRMFGMDLKDLTEESIRGKLEEIDNQFDLIMLMERFDESLVLLADTLCWNLEDVVTLKLNSRSNTLKVTLCHKQ